MEAFYSQAANFVIKQNFGIGHIFKFNSEIFTCLEMKFNDMLKNYKKKKIVNWYPLNKNASTENQRTTTLTTPILLPIDL